MVGLSAAQKEKLRIKLGDKTSAMASALVEMLVTSPDGSEWVHTGFSGAIVLCVERGKGSPVWSLKLLDPETLESKLEQEINSTTGYAKSTEYFHTFNSDNAIVGLEFQDEADADAFVGKVNAVPVKPEGAASPLGEESKAPSGPAAPAVTSPITSPAGGSKKSFLTGLGKYFKPKPGFGVTTEALTISGPTNFVRVQHIGYDAATGAFDIDSIPEEWKAMFKKAGVKKKDLRDSHTASELMGTIKGFKPLSAPPAPPAPPPPPPPPAAPVPKLTKPVSKEGEDEPSKSESKSTTTLLSEIQQGVQLRKAAPPDLKRMATEEKLDLEAQLRAKMEALRGHIEAEDEEPDDWD